MVTIIGRFLCYVLGHCAKSQIVQYTERCIEVRRLSVREIGVYMFIACLIYSTFSSIGFVPSTLMMGHFIVFNQFST